MWPKTLESLGHRWVYVIGFKMNLIEFFLNYTKLAMLAIKAYVEKSKINSTKKLPLVGIEPVTSGDPHWCLPDWANWHCL